MKTEIKKVRLIVIALSLIIVISIAIVGMKYICNEPGSSVNTTSAKPTTEDSSFSIIFFNFTQQYMLDTFQGVISRGNVSLTLSLSAEEKREILQKMIEVDFFNLPYDCSIQPPPGTPYQLVFPCYIKVEYNSQTKDVFWSDILSNPINQHVKLTEFVNLLRALVESKEEYKKLPKPLPIY